MNGFDIIAPVYDKLARLFFGRAIAEAQQHFLDHVSKARNVLIVGGGTGDIAKLLLQKFSYINIVYVDTSKVMIEKAKVKCADFDARIVFVNDSAFSLGDATQFDVILTPFFLDMFSEETISGIVQFFKQILANNGKWIVTDFQTTKRWHHRVLLWIMYRFFRLVCKIEATQLADWDKSLRNQLDYHESELFYSGFIRSAVYMNIK